MMASNAFMELVTSFQPAELGPGPRSGVLPAPELDERVETLFEQSTVSQAAQQAVRALVLLWHDHLDVAHTIAQGIANPDGSFVHAIMHRREPDYWNSKYWWRRVGEHLCFPELARRAGDHLHTKGAAALSARLLPAGKWDAFAFVDACEAAAGRILDSEQVRLLREVQRIEFETALAHFLDDKPH